MNTCHGLDDTSAASSGGCLERQVRDPAESQARVLFPFLMPRVNRRHSAWLNLNLGPAWSDESLTSTDDADLATSTQLPLPPLALLLRHVKVASGFG